MPYDFYLHHINFYFYFFIGNLSLHTFTYEVIYYIVLSFALLHIQVWSKTCFVATSALDVLELLPLQNCTKFTKPRSANVMWHVCSSFQEAPELPQLQHLQPHSLSSSSFCRRAFLISSTFLRYDLWRPLIYEKIKKNSTLKISLSPNISSPLSTRTTSCHVVVILLQLFAFVHVSFLENAQLITS